MPGRVVPRPRFLLFRFLANCAVLALVSIRIAAAPFDERIEFRQPDGALIHLHGWGDEFHAIFETLDGYTVVYDQSSRAYCFATSSIDGTLTSTGLPAHKANPLAAGVPKHLRMTPEARKRMVVQRWQRWEMGTQNQKRWEEHKAALRQYNQQLDGTGGSTTNPPELSPPTSTTTGTKVGLTLLIDFSDAPATVPQAEIINFCNADGYAGYGNNGSVKSYFYDNSKGILTYTNVVTIYIRAPQPKSYYNDPAKDCGAQGNILIKAALDTMKALPNYNTDILPAFAALTADGSSRVVACNVFYAGGNGGVWSYGLWPHSWSLYNAGQQSLGNGKYVYKYQLSNIGTSLALGTFCHENGHMLCGYPDVYDYDYDSTGGAGVFCLMNSGGSGTNPKQICAYLKRASGWATTVALNSASELLASVTATSGTADFNKFYRYQKPGVSTEYYLIENRCQSGRDSALPASGLAIWHVDELGDHNNQGTNFNTTHLNYEVSLVQADNQYHFQKNANSGDAYDLYYAGNPAAEYSNAFTDVSGPSARWWDGSSSGLIITNISASGATMTFRVGSAAPLLNLVSVLLADANGNGKVDFNETNRCWLVLRNDGVQNATGVGAAISSITAGVSVLQNTSSYSTVIPGQLVTNNTPFLFYAASNFVCGTPVTFTVLASGSGRTTTNTAVFSSGSSDPARADSAVPLDIPDLATVYSTNVLSGFTGQVAGLTVSLHLTHTFDHDLVLDLIGPDNTTVNLVNSRGSNGDNFGEDCIPDARRTTFDDAASQPISAGSPSFVGSYRPEQPLAAFAGKSGAAVNGPWRLRIQDAAKKDTGTLQCWSLRISPPVNCIDGAFAPPIISFDTPIAGAVFASGAPITLSASASDVDSPIASVEFYDASTLLAALVAPPYYFEWTNASPGAHALSARAVDSTGLTATAGANIGVSPGIAIPPAVLSLTFSNGLLNIWWPANLPDFYLQQQVGALGSEWSDVAGATNNQWAAPLNPEARTMFFRLIKR